MKLQIAFLRTVVWFFTLVLFVQGCGVSAGNPNSTLPPKGTTPKGNLNFKLAQEPLKGFDKLIFKVTAIEFLPDTNEGEESSDEQDSGTVSSWISIPFSPPLEFDLLSARALKKQNILKNAELPAGKYKEIRLVLDKDRPIVGMNKSAEIPIWIERGQTQKDSEKKWISLQQNFTIDEVGQNNIEFRFKLSESIVPFDPAGTDSQILNEREKTQNYKFKFKRTQSAPVAQVSRGTVVGSFTQQPTDDENDDNDALLCLVKRESENAVAKPSQSQCTGSSEIAAISQEESFSFFDVPTGAKYDLWAKPADKDGEWKFVYGGISPVAKQIIDAATGKQVQEDEE